MSLYYFYDTIAYKNNGRSSDSPKGYKLDPMTFTVLSINAVSCPSNGMYIYDPKIIYLGFVSCKKGRVIFSNTVIKPSVVMT